MFAHGFNIHFGRIDPPGDRRRRRWSRRRAPATSSARVYQAGGGVPALFAVHQRRDRDRPRADPGLRPRPSAATRAGVLETTFAEETETDLFGEQSVLCGGTSALVKDGVRDPRRGRLPAGARLLRDDARAQADRRPDVPRRPQLHALQRQRHRGVRRLRVRTADHRRARPRRRCSRSSRTSRTARSPIAGSPRTRPAATSSNGSAPQDRDHQIEQVGGRLRAQMAFLNPVEVEAGQAQAAATTPASLAMSAAAVPRSRRPVRGGGHRPHLRHDAPRRRAGAGRRPDRGREARGRAAARAAQGRRHRGRLPGRLARRLRGGPADRPGDPRRHRGRGARALPRRRPAAGDRGDQGRRAAAPPRLHRDERHPPQAQAPHRPRARRWPRRVALGAPRRASSWAATPRSSSPPRTPRAPTSSTCCQVYEAVVEAGASTVNIPDTVGYAIPAEFGALVGKVVDLVGRRGHGQRPLPQRPRAGHGQHARGRAGRGAPGGGHDQRPRRARGQRVARGGRDGTAHAARPSSPSSSSGVADRADHRRQPAGQLPDRLRDPAQQGDRRRQRLRARIRDPPGRRDQEPADLRDHDPAVGRACPAAS